MRTQQLCAIHMEFLAIIKAGKPWGVEEVAKGCDLHQAYFVVQIFFAIVLVQRIHCHISCYSAWWLFLL